jgi:hypothetical protein
VPAWVEGRYYWTRVAATYSDGTTTYSTPVLASALNQSLVTSLQAITNTQTLQTTVSQHATAISLNASSITTLKDRVTTAEASITVQAGEIALKASQTTVDLLTGRVTAAESAIIQNADYFSLSLSKQNKAINDLTGANILQTPWERGSLSSTDGSEILGASYVRSDWFDVAETRKYLLQTFEGTGTYSIYGTAGLFYYREDKSFLSYTTNGNTTAHFTVPAGAKYLRVRFPTTNPPESINCYLLPTEIVGGYIDLTTITSMVKLQVTTDTMLITVSETVDAIGTPFKVQRWERGSLDTSTGAEVVSSNALRSGYIEVKPGERYIAQLQDGSSLSAIYFYYAEDMSFVSSISVTGSPTIPANTAKMRVRVTTSIEPDVYTGNVYPGTVRQDYTKVSTIYSALLMQKDLINLRVSKNDVVNQINISTEGILISGSKIHITGMTTIDNAVITNAMIANLDAGKINAGTISADRIAAGSITSNKLTVADGFITNAMIANATIQSAKIAAIDAGKITAGTLDVGRIAANSITADKLATNAIQVGLAGWTSTIRITPTTISWYDGSTLAGYIDNNGMRFYYGTQWVSAMGQTYKSGDQSTRGLMMSGEPDGGFFAWTYRHAPPYNIYLNQFT